MFYVNAHFSLIRLGFGASISLSDKRVQRAAEVGFQGCKQDLRDTLVTYRTRPLGAADAAATQASPKSLLNAHSSQVECRVTHFKGLKMYTHTRAPSALLRASRRFQTRVSYVHAQRMDNDAICGHIKSSQGNSNN